MTSRYYSARLTKGGPIVGVKLVHCGPILHGEEQDRSPRWQALVDTEQTGRYVWQFSTAGWPVEADGCSLRVIAEIDEPEYLFLTARGAWAQEHSPYHIAAAPREAVDLRKLPALF